jgi:hypothetical protein
MTKRRFITILKIILICAFISVIAVITIVSIKKGSGTQGTVKYKRFEKLTQPSGQVIQIGDYSFELEKYFLDIASAQFYAVVKVGRDGDKISYQAIRASDSGRSLQSIGERFSIWFADVSVEEEGDFLYLYIYRRLQSEQDPNQIFAIRDCQAEDELNKEYYFNLEDSGKHTEFRLNEGTLYLSSMGLKIEVKRSLGLDYFQDLVLTNKDGENITLIKDGESKAAYSGSAFFATDETGFNGKYVYKFRKIIDYTSIEKVVVNGKTYEQAEDTQNQQEDITYK